MVLWASSLRHMYKRWTDSLVSPLNVFCHEAEALEIQDLYHLITEVSLSLERLDFGQRWQVVGIF